VCAVPVVLREGGEVDSSEGAEGELCRDTRGLLESALLLHREVLDFAAGSAAKHRRVIEVPQIAKVVRKNGKGFQEKQQLLKTIKLLLFGGMAAEQATTELELRRRD